MQTSMPIWRRRRRLASLPVGAGVASSNRRRHTFWHSRWVEQGSPSWSYSIYHSLPDDEVRNLNLQASIFNASVDKNNSQSGWIIIVGPANHNAPVVMITMVPMAYDEVFTRLSSRWIGNLCWSWRNGVARLARRKNTIYISAVREKTFEWYTTMTLEMGSELTNAAICVHLSITVCSANDW